MGLIRKLPLPKNVISKLVMNSATEDISVNPAVKATGYKVLMVIESKTVRYLTQHVSGGEAFSTFGQYQIKNVRFTASFTPIRSHRQLSARVKPPST